MTERKTKRSLLRVLRTGDPQSFFHHFTAKEILEKLGPPRQLLSTSTKTDKSRKVGVLSKILYLTSGVFCPSATQSCLKVCLGHSSGRMTMLQSANARDRRSALYLEDQEHFMHLLRADLYYLRAEAKALGLVPAVRLNGTSDIPWERLHGELFTEFNDIQFYDYTKLRPRMWHFLRGRLVDQPFPPNYHLTFSLSEKNNSDAEALLEAGGNVAVVFWPVVPDCWNGYHVIPADKHDARFLDKTGCVVGLSAKGIAREDLSGFVVRTADASARLNVLNAA
ncbi:GP88 family protein [Bythopirellula goksoeyrii]|uniref:Gene product 88 domain-containing protein n=1 Tax=Bythopirellula goksoeyrii TaxID=1400387 RepID=A0A5B9QF16_9BACT|nr:hypothetical protein [Bythopirellula goksoeyrii]QEG36205.1 hypothetical protein Pr1d_35170 [Bythopirellula goksoeyrii]